jgi:hypothetical protein
MGAQTGRAVNHQGTAILSPRVLDGPMSERRHDRRRESSLSQYHGAGSEEQAE